MKPQCLQKGDKIAIVSLSRGLLGEPFIAHELELGVKRLKELELIEVVSTLPLMSCVKLKASFMKEPLPYSPESNGVAERKNRTLKEMMNCMLVSSGAPENLWGKLSLLPASYKIGYLIRRPVRHPMNYGRATRLTSST